MNNKFEPVIFAESNADFYDLEYFISMEYRYFSGAHGSRIRNILSTIGEVKALRCLDIGCGGAYFTNELHKKGANIIGIDYSKHAIRFGKTRYPHLDLRVNSAYKLNSFDPHSFDLITLIDVIEHINNHHKLLSEIYRILKDNGRLVISTDIENCPWSKPPFSKLINWLLHFSAEGKAFLLIKKVEAYRKQFKNYHASHISPLTYERIEELLGSENFKIINHRIYPIVEVPLRDIFLKLFPKRYRGDHQCITAKKIR